MKQNFLFLNSSDNIFVEQPLITHWFLIFKIPILIHKFRIMNIAFSKINLFRSITHPLNTDYSPSISPISWKFFKFSFSRHILSAQLTLHDSILSPWRLFTPKEYRYRFLHPPNLLSLAVLCKDTVRVQQRTVSVRGCRWDKQLGERRRRRKWSKGGKRRRGRPTIRIVPRPRTHHVYRPTNRPLCRA